MERLQGAEPLNRLLADPSRSEGLEFCRELLNLFLDNKSLYLSVKMAASSWQLPLNKTKCEMEVSNVEISKIRQDLDMLVMLYQRLVDRMIPVEEASADEKEALESKEEVFGRAELDKALE